VTGSSSVGYLGVVMLLRRQVFRNLCHARDLLHEVHDQHLPIDEVARRVEISPSHFIRQFEAVFGDTPHQYRIRVRVERAKELLAAGSHSVTEVCMELGFSSLGSFSTMFARRVGETPSAYRRRTRLALQVPRRARGEIVRGCLGLMAALPPDAFRSFREA
jgi:AraC-like DNA-binding protein